MHNSEQNQIDEIFNVLMNTSLRKKKASIAAKIGLNKFDIILIISALSLLCITILLAFLARDYKSPFLYTLSLLFLLILLLVSYGMVIVETYGSFKLALRSLGLTIEKIRLKTQQHLMMIDELTKFDRFKLLIALNEIRHEIKNRKELVSLLFGQIYSVGFISVILSVIYTIYHLRQPFMASKYLNNSSIELAIAFLIGLLFGAAWSLRNARKLEQYAFILENAILKIDSNSSKNISIV